jgi:thiamine biosynthesis lipoprotein ApbE
MLTGRFEFVTARICACFAKLCFSGCQEKRNRKKREQGKRKKYYWQGLAAHMDPALHDKKKKRKEKKKEKEKGTRQKL